MLIRLVSPITRLSAWAGRLPRSTRVAMMVLIDALLCVFACWLAFSLRLGVFQGLTREMMLFMGIALLCWLPIFGMHGIYTTILRFAGNRSISRLARATAVFAVPMTLAFTLNQIPGIPRTAAMIQAIVFFLLLMSFRIVGRHLLVELQGGGVVRSGNVAIYGTTVAGQQLGASMRRQTRYNLLAFLSEDAAYDGKSLDGVPVYHANRLETVIAEYGLTDILLAVPDMARSRRIELMRELEAHNIRVRQLPGVDQVLSDSVEVSDLRPVRIEDLLGRDPVPPVSELMERTVAGKVVLVTGAGGSIGSELVRQIGKLDPVHLILCEMSEFALYDIEQEMLRRLATMSEAERFTLTPELLNVTDASVVNRIIERYRPDTIFHAAAYKHVPLVEGNPIAGVRNNVFGTLNVAQAAQRAAVGRMILISTDKAVRPTNVMGASKRACELVLQALAAEGGPTCFTMVRFGNVLGSSGSVVPRFDAQIRAGGPVTLTHRDVTRYFMTIPEAAALVIQAGAMAQGGEVFVLDMGESVKIIDLARSMIRLSGLTVRDADDPDGDIEIREVGLRPGEKLYEELLIGNNPQPTPHPRIMQAREGMLPWATLSGQLEQLRATIDAGDAPGVLQMVRTLVPEYAPDDAGSAQPGV